tara:strand:+ start:146 stop:469 length:324 start_codon:yes stop_codon:yes gene_type:complete
MKILKMDKMIGGWFVGDFEPTAYRTKDFEVCYKFHPKGEVWPKHYHEKSVEINYLIRGTMTIQNTNLAPGDIFVLDRGEIADPIFLEDCEIIVVKTPSAPDDKVVIE